MTSYVPFRLLGTSDLAGLKDALSVPLAAWSREWLGDEQGAGIENLESADDQYRPKVQRLLTAGEGRWCVVIGAEIDRRLAKVLLRGDDSDTIGIGASAIVAELVDQSLRALAAGLTGVGDTSTIHTHFDNGSLPADANTSGRQSVKLCLRLADYSFQIMLSPGSVVEKLKPRPTSLESRRNLTRIVDAVANETVNLKVNLGSAELSLGELASLQPGDVIPLDRTVQDNATIAVDGRDLGCRAQLGKREEHKAIRLTSGTGAGTN